jgi:hypothetical protein
MSHCADEHVSALCRAPYCPPGSPSRQSGAPAHAGCASMMRRVQIADGAISPVPEPPFPRRAALASYRQGSRALATPAAHRAQAKGRGLGFKTCDSFLIGVVALLFDRRELNLLGLVVLAASGLTR